MTIHSMVHVTIPFMGCGDGWARHMAGDLWVLFVFIAIKQVYCVPSKAGEQIMNTVKTYVEEPTSF